MKRYIFIICTVIIKLNISGQINYVWSNKYTSSSVVYPVYSNGPTSNRGIITDNAGNVYTTGYYDSDLSVYGLSGQSNFTANGGGDIYVAKHTSTGNLQWAFSIGSSAFDASMEMTLDNNEDVLIAGIYAGNIDMDPSATGTLTLPAPVPSNGTTDLFFAKYNHINGNMIWAKNLHGLTDEDIQMIKSDSQGNIYICGFFRETVDFDPSVATYTLYAGASVSKGFFAKYDSNGNFLWVNKFGNTNGDDVTGIDVDANNNIYISGRLYGNFDFDYGAGTAMGITGNHTGFIASYTSNGDYRWHKLIDRYFGGNDINNLYVKGKDLVVTGRFQNNMIVPLLTGNDTLFPLAGATNYDAFFIKLDTLGNMYFVKQVGGNATSEICENIFIDNSGRIYIAGEITGPNNVYFNGYNASSGFLTTTSTVDNDLFCARYDSLGNFDYAYKIGNTGFNYGNTTVDNNYNLLLIGCYKGLCDIDPTATVHNYNSGANEQCFIEKLCQVPERPSLISNNDTMIVCNNTAAILNATGMNTIKWYSAATGGSPIATGNTFTTNILTQDTQLFIESSNGSCISQRKKIILKITPEVHANTNKTTICQGDSVLLYATGTAANYNWNKNVIDSMWFHPNTGYYTLTGVDTSGCLRKDSIHIYVDMTNAVFTSTTICKNTGMVNLNIGVPQGGTYSGGIVSANTINTSTLAVGWYNITYAVIDSMGCFISKNDSIHIDTCFTTNLSEKNAINEIDIYPSPTNDILNVGLQNSNLDICLIEFFDYTGKKIITVKPLYSEREIKINVSDFKTGVYFIILYDNKNICTKYKFSKL